MFAGFAVHCSETMQEPAIMPTCTAAPTTSHGAGVHPQGAEEERRRYSQYSPQRTLHWRRESMLEFPNNETLVAVNRLYEQIGDGEAHGHDIAKGISRSRYKAGDYGDAYTSVRLALFAEFFARYVLTK
jgi:hypothetical protein